jgi:cob(I)alamin adenosyltransferase
MSIATKTGDQGTTGLMYNRRVVKTDARIAANGAVDELNAALGLARASLADPLIGESLISIQRELVTLMGEIAVETEDSERYVRDGFQLVSGEMVDRLTELVEDLEKNHHITYKGWATPGATMGSAALDVARTVCRRAERCVAGLVEAGTLTNPEILRYLNRLSDLCWLYARWVETKVEDSPLQSSEV